MTPRECARPPHAAAMPELVPHAGMLRRYLFVLGAPGDRLDDLVQETFVLVLQRGLEDRGPGPVGAWLRGAARHLLLRDRRSAAARREVELADEVWQQHCGADDGEARLDALRRCVETLPARSRTLLERCYGERGRRGEIGAGLDLLPEGLKTALRRLRAALRLCVQRRLRGER